MVVNYVEYEDLPRRMVEHIREPWQHLEIGISLLELLDNRFMTSRNISDIKIILQDYFEVELKKLESIKIHVGEFKTVFVDFNLFKIRIYVDLD